jgi:protein phosphatase
MAVGMDVDRHDVETARGDVWLLCSDGLTNLVPDEAIASVLDRGGPSAAMSRALIDAALAASGPGGEPRDDITVVVNVIE